MNARDHAEPDDTHPADPAGTTHAGAGGAVATPLPLVAPSEGPPSLLAALPYAVGVLALVGYLVFVVVLYHGAATAREELWMRTLYLFGGVESMAFAAAGFFFGREVNRARAEGAETRAAHESRRAEAQHTRAERAETKGRTLTRDLRDLTDVASDAIRPTGDLTALVRRAERMFPPV